MRQIVTIKDREAELAFIKKAAAAFAADPRMASYGQLDPGSLLALRWGLHNRAILLLKLDESFASVTYGDVIPAADDGSQL